VLYQATRKFVQSLLCVGNASSWRLSSSGCSAYWVRPWVWTALTETSVLVRLDTKEVPDDDDPDTYEGYVGVCRSGPD
jgi:hypothetical protein